MRKVIGLLVGFVGLVGLGYWYSSLPPAQATVGDVTIDQSVGGTSTLGVVTGQKFVDTASATYFLDPAATGNSLVVAGAATISGQFTAANTFTFKSVSATELGLYDSTNTLLVSFDEGN